MSGQLWGECGWCERRKRVTKASGILYRHEDPETRDDCQGSGTFPVLDSVRAATKVSLTKQHIIPLQVGDIRAPWAAKMTNAEIVEELRELIERGPAAPGRDIVDTYSDPYLKADIDELRTWEDDGGFWDRYYWCVVGIGLTVLLAGAAFAGGVVWGRR